MRENILEDENEIADDVEAARHAYQRWVDQRMEVQVSVDEPSSQSNVSDGTHERRLNVRHAGGEYLLLLRKKSVTRKGYPR